MKKTKKTESTESPRDRVGIVYRKDIESRASNILFCSVGEESAAVYLDEKNHVLRLKLSKMRPCDGERSVCSWLFLLSKAQFKADTENVVASTNEEFLKFLSECSEVMVNVNHRDLLLLYIDATWDKARRSQIQAKKAEERGIVPLQF